MTEEIELVTIPLREAVDAIFDGRLLDEPSALALLLAERRLAGRAGQPSRARR